MVVSETLEVSAETDVESEDMLPPYCVNKNSEDSESLKDIEDDCDTSRTSKEDDKEIFGSKADLQLHTQIHMREAKPYKCAQCNKAFANSSYLSQHTRIHLGIKPYKCDLCPRKFTQASQLKQHMNIHLTVKKFMCEICQRKFTQLSHLQQHIRTHTGDKPYKCRHPGCTKAFSQLSNLQSHSRCHQTDKPYKCNSCYKCFVDETALLEHIPKHKESKHLKTHICQYCGKSYTQETYLAKHMQKHSDRPADKRTSGGAAGQPASNTQQQQQTSATAAAVAAAAGIMPQATPAQAAAAEAYGWPKMDPATAYAAVHERDYGSLMTDPRLNLHHMEDLSRQHSQYTGGNGGYDNTNAGNIKTSSAFSPIQGSMPLASSGFVGGRGGYPFYDSIGFPKHHSQVGFDSKPGGNGFPNQLISLAQIRNYGHQPTDLHSLKEKVTQ